MTKPDTAARPTMEQMKAELYSAVVADALDSLGYRRQSPPGPLRAMTGVDRLIGRCRTTLWTDMAHEDPRPYELELEAVDGCRPGDVIVCAAHGSMRSGIWGELLSTAARNSGCVGVVIDGAVRDVAKMTAMGFPVFARGVSVYDSLHRQRVIDVDVPVEIQGVRIASGDLLIADTDGVVIVPQAIEEETVRRAWDKIHSENRTRDALRAGMKAKEVYATYGVL